MKNILLLAAISGILGSCSTKPAEPAAEAIPVAPPAIEIADAKYTEVCKQAYSMLANGDIDAYMTAFSENAKYFWSAGDSLVGKSAIAAYWKDRRGNVIDSLSLSRHVWIPVKINQPEPGHLGGTWVLNWSLANVKYKNGKKLAMWIHTDFHFDATGQVDQVIQFLDRAPINAALSKK